MTQILAAFQWLSDPARWAGANGIPMRLGEHLSYSVLGVALAALIAIPLGVLVGHTGTGKELALALAGGARALPTLGLVTLLGLLLGIGLLAPTLAFVVLAVPSLLAGAVNGTSAAPRSVVDAARAQGMTEWQILTRVEVPLGLPLFVGGMRAAMIQVIATAMLAAYIGNGGLGRYIFLGLSTQDYPQMLAGSILVIALALVVDLVLAFVQRLSQPAPRTAARATRTHATSREAA